MSGWWLSFNNSLLIYETLPWYYQKVLCVSAKIVWCNGWIHFKMIIGIWKDSERRVPFYGVHFSVYSSNLMIFSKFLENLNISIIYNCKPSWHWTLQIDFRKKTRFYIHTSYRKLKGHRKQTARMSYRLSLKELRSRFLCLMYFLRETWRNNSCVADQGYAVDRLSQSFSDSDLEFHESDQDDDL